MFDAGRILIFAWAFVRVVRARSWLAATALAITAYLFALSVASGITIREDGPMNPIMAVLLAVIGPSALPRGRLPPLPFASAVVAAPAIVNVVLCATLLVTARRLLDRARHTPEFSDATLRLGQAATAIVLVAVFEGFAASIRLLPDFLDWGTCSFNACCTSAATAATAPTTAVMPPTTSPDRMTRSCEVVHGGSLRIG